jgi:hypothetical protein
LNWSQVWQFVSPALVLVGVFVTARFTYRAEAKKAEEQRIAAEVQARAQKDTAEIQGESTVGQLALNIANRADEKADKATIELERLKRHLHRVERWWPQHERVDQAILQELEKLDPGVVATLPVPPHFPSYEPRPIDWLSTRKRVTVEDESP